MTRGVPNDGLPRADGHFAPPVISRTDRDWARRQLDLLLKLAVKQDDHRAYLHEQLEEAELAFFRTGDKRSLALVWELEPLLYPGSGR